jgi:hypothetical protein
VPELVLVSSSPNFKHEPKVSVPVPEPVELSVEVAVGVAFSLPLLPFFLPPALLHAAKRPKLISIPPTTNLENDD